MANYFYKGTALVFLNGKMGRIDKNGKETWDNVEIQK